jgi:hypothetical protein
VVGYSAAASATSGSTWALVTDKGVVEVELTEDAMRHGLAIALPERVVVVLARPARDGRTQTTLVRVPIRGRAEWLAASRERSAS